MITFLNFVISLHFLFNSPEPRTFILGNSSADLDSVISSLVLAYSLQTSSTDRSYIPVVSCTPIELLYRFDLVYVLKQEGVDLSALLYVNSLDSLRPNDEIILVDHNTEIRSEFVNYVTRVIDHHSISDVNRQIKPEDIIRFPRASALSIILEEFIFNKQSYFCVS